MKTTCLRRATALRALSGATLAGSLFALMPGIAQAQVIERNPAPAPQPPAPLAKPDIAPDSAADATPLGMNLASIVVGEGASIAPAAPGEVTLQLDRAMPKLQQTLRGYLNQPLSLKLIAAIKADIARAWRNAGYPFVHITAPEQDLSEGRLVLRVAEFRLGEARVEGTSEAEARRITRGVRQKAGEAIDFNGLAEDLEWLNRYPFRRVEAVFAPGKAAGDSDVTYRVKDVTPISMGGGYANSGSPRTGQGRYFINALAGLPGTDVWGSYQLTTSGQRWFDLGDGPAGSRRYLSHAARVSLPIASRTAVELNFGDIRSSQPIQAFASRQHTREWSLTARTALSNVAASLPGEISLGVDWKQQRSRLTFGATDVIRNAYDVGQIELGYDWHGYDARGETAVDLMLHASPGGLNDKNSDRAFRVASQGAFGNAQYLYATGSVYRRTVFGRISLVQAFDWQFAGTALPQTEQRGLGGRGQVRAYTLDDGAFDRSAILRNEVRFAGTPIGKGATAVQWTPSLFLEGGYAGQAGGKTSKLIGAAGAGLDLSLGNHLSLSADGAFALRDQGDTKAGDLRGNVRVTARF